jgi:hypothetical protein
LHKSNSSKKFKGALEVIKKMDRKEAHRKSRHLFSETDTDTDTSVDEEFPRHKKLAVRKKPGKAFLDAEAKEDKKKRTQKHSVY